VDNADGLAFGDDVFAPPPALTCQALETDDDDGGGGPTASAKGTFPAKQRPRPHPNSHRDALHEWLLKPDGGKGGGKGEKAQRFQAWAKVHGKGYGSGGEEAQRAAQFHATEWRVASLARSFSPVLRRRSLRASPSSSLSSSPSLSRAAIFLYPWSHGRIGT
jgi:hypothetical protein